MNGLMDARIYGWFYISVGCCWLVDLSESLPRPLKCGIKASEINHLRLRKQLFP